MQIAQRVLTHQEDEIIAGETTAQAGKGVFGVRRTNAIEIGSVNLKTIMTIDRKLEHRNSVHGGGQGLIRFVGRVTGRYEEHPIEFHCKLQLGRNDEMPDVHWVKRTAENAQSSRFQPRSPLPFGAFLQLSGATLSLGIVRRV